MAKLSTAARKKLKPSQFALPGGRYPVEDPSHARDALARASEQFARGKLSESEYKEVRAKAHAKLRGRK